MTDVAHTGLSADTQALMAFEASKKSTGVTYLLWFLLGGLGGHRFYLGRTGSAVGQLVLNIFSWMTIWFGLGFFTLAALGVWLIVDIFLIPGMAQEHNAALMKRLNVVSRPAAPAAPAVPHMADELAKFAALKDSGAITPEEYEVQKARIMGTTLPVATPVATTAEERAPGAV
ncbi:NINE protein [Caulobacter endophyticus]|uniref:TM2 domain-containing membrane protein YozV n=1 Tax=Caulobacter endophyticus TaxID=2172652 RepID=A0A2T9JQ44_9CAUL|nr:NINE protein [Caulobacter endophyticus]PVM85814.1 hypothetical protein DDF67_16580 [Caulobacter endophyticus]